MGHLQVNTAGTSHGSKGNVSFEKKTKNSRACSHSSLHQGIDHSTGVEAAKVIVGLPCAHKHDWLACDVSHGDGCTNL